MLAISTASIAELHFGVLVTTDPDVRAERLRRLSELQRTFDALPVDDDVATSYGRLTAAVVASGRQPRARVVDLLIAATAHAHSARLYTRNRDDMAAIDQPGQQGGRGHSSGGLELDKIGGGSGAGKREGASAVGAGTGHYAVATKERPHS